MPSPVISWWRHSVHPFVCL